MDGGATGGGWTIANVIALVAGAASLGFNLLNWLYTQSTRVKALSLDHFNANARQPLTSVLSELEDVADRIEMLRFQSPPDPALIATCAATFHTSRRRMERLLNKLQRSDVIPGESWITLNDNECDLASEAFENARATLHSDVRDQSLVAAETQIRQLVKRLVDTMDAETKRLIK